MKPLTREVTTTPDTEAMKAMSAMSKNPIHRLLVLDRDRLVGIVTMKDLMRFLSLKLDLEHHPA
jgi:CBS domain-containing protein